MKKPLLIILSVFMVLTLGVSVMAAEASPSPEQSGARAFSTVETISEPAAPAAMDSTGVVLWSLLIVLVAAIMVYMVINAVKMRKADKIRLENEAVKPRLVVTLGYRRSK